MKRKVDKDVKIEENTLLLITKDIWLKGNNYILKKKKGKHNYNIPGIFIKYINDDIISVTIKITFEDNEIFKKNNILNINKECCRFIDNFGYLYYLEQNGEALSEKDKETILNSNSWYNI